MRLRLVILSVILASFAAACSGSAPGAATSSDTADSEMTETVTPAPPDGAALSGVVSQIKPESSTEIGRQSDEHVTASKVIQAFEANAIAAHQMYGGKILLVTGAFTDIQVDSDGGASILLIPLATAVIDQRVLESSIRCSISEKNTSPFVSLSGPITVRGQLRSQGGGLELYDCTLAEDSPGLAAIQPDYRFTDEQLEDEFRELGRSSFFARYWGKVFSLTTSFGPRNFRPKVRVCERLEAEVSPGVDQRMAVRVKGVFGGSEAHPGVFACVIEEVLGLTAVPTPAPAAPAPAARAAVPAPAAPAPAPAPVPTLTPTSTPIPTPTPTPISPPEGAFYAAYYNNRSLEGTPVLVRNEWFIDHDWGRGSPATGVNNDNFSVRWVGRFVFQEGEYVFTCSFDTGCRVWVDDSLLIDDWRYKSTRTVSEMISLATGEHEVRVEYYEADTIAEIHVNWALVPTAAPPPEGVFSATYYNNTSLEGIPALIRNENVIDHDWGNGSPDDRVNSDSFSVRWLGSFSFEEGDYVFTASTDDGIRVWVDNGLLIDSWKNQRVTTYQGGIRLVTGKHVVKVEYYEKSGQAVAEVSWERISPTPAEEDRRVIFIQGIDSESGNTDCARTGFIDEASGKNRVQWIVDYLTEQSSEWVRDIVPSLDTPADFFYFSYSGEYCPQGDNLDNYHKPRYVKKDTCSGVVDAAIKLQEMVETLSANSASDAKFDIIAHSMGGMVTAFWLTRFPEMQARVNSVVTFDSTLRGVSDKNFLPEFSVPGFSGGRACNSSTSLSWNDLWCQVYTAAPRENCASKIVSSIAEVGDTVRFFTIDATQLDVPSVEFVSGDRTTLLRSKSLLHCQFDDDHTSVWERSETDGAPINCWNLFTYPESYLLEGYPPKPGYINIQEPSREVKAIFVACAVTQPTNLEGCKARLR